MDLHHLLTEIPLMDGLEQWCVASKWEINPESNISLEDYLAYALHTLRIGPIEQIQQDISQGVRSIDLIRSKIEKLKQLEVASKKTEISELACYAVLKWEQMYDDVSNRKFLDCLVSQGAPQDSPGGIDSIAFIFSPNSANDDLLILGEVKGAEELTSKDPNNPFPPSRRFQSFSQQTTALVKRFQEEIPQDRLFYDLNRIEEKVRLATHDENMCKRVRMMNTKYVERNQGVQIISFLVFKKDWIDNLENYNYLKKYLKNLRKLTTPTNTEIEIEIEVDEDAVIEAREEIEENKADLKILENQVLLWSKEQTFVMLFPIPNWAEPEALQQIYDRLSIVLEG